VKYAKLVLFLILIGKSSAAVFTNTFDTPVIVSGSGAGTGPVEGKWYADRYSPAIFTNAAFQSNVVLDIGVSAVDYFPATPFINKQGRSFNLSNAGIGSFISADLYLPASWANTQVTPGLWATGQDPTNNPSLNTYPIIGFFSDGAGDAHFQIWDDDLGYVALATPFTWDSWYTLGINLTAEGVVYSINGTDVYTNTADAGTDHLSNVIFNSVNYGANYDAYWDNLVTPSSTVSVPEPGTMTFLALGGLLLWGARRLRRARA